MTMTRSNLKKISDISYLLRLAQAGSCTCMTKTHVHHHHKKDCRYRLLRETEELVEDLKKNG